MQKANEEYEGKTPPTTPEEWEWWRHYIGKERILRLPEFPEFGKEDFVQIGLIALLDAIHKYGKEEKFFFLARRVIAGKIVDAIREIRGRREDHYKRKHKLVTLREDLLEIPIINKLSYDDVASLTIEESLLLRMLSLGFSQTEIARMCGRSVSRICQIRTKALAKLGDRLKDEAPFPGEEKAEKEGKTFKRIHRAVQKKHKWLTLNRCKSIVSSVFYSLAEIILEDGQAEVPGFGKFHLVDNRDVKFHLTERINSAWESLIRGRKNGSSRSTKEKSRAGSKEGD